MQRVNSCKFYPFLMFKYDMILDTFLINPSEACSSNVVYESSLLFLLTLYIRKILKIPSSHLFMIHTTSNEERPLQDFPAILKHLLQYYWEILSEYIHSTKYVMDRAVIWSVIASTSLYIQWLKVIHTYILYLYFKVVNMLLDMYKP